MKTLFIQMSNECYDGGNASNAWSYVKGLQKETGIDFDNVILKKEAEGSSAPKSRLGAANKLWRDSSVWKTTVSGGSVALIDHDTLHEAFLNKAWGTLPVYDTDSSPYLFAVIDHNSAHHISYLLAKWAFEKHGRKGTVKVVINFDQHEDYGSKNIPGKLINCGGWGSYVVSGPPQGSKCSRSQFKVDCYVSVGNGKKEGGAIGKEGVIGKHICKSGQFYTNIYSKGAKNDQNPTAAIVANKDNLLKKLGTKIGRGLIPWDIYVTVDRDCIQNNDTPYGHGVHKAEIVRNAVYNLLRDMRNTRSALVGFDIIGLPHHTSVNKNIAYTDIRHFYTMVKNYPIKTWPTYNPKSKNGMAI
jgi:hypothetical protein